MSASSQTQRRSAAQLPSRPAAQRSPGPPLTVAPPITDKRLGELRQEAGIWPHVLSIDVNQLLTRLDRLQAEHELLLLELRQLRASTPVEGMPTPGKLLTRLVQRAAGHDPAACDFTRGVPGLCPGCRRALGQASAGIFTEVLAEGAALGQLAPDGRRLVIDLLGLWTAGRLPPSMAAPSEPEGACR